MGAAATWKDLAFLFVKFPLGIVSLVIVTVVVSVPAAFITAPFTVSWADWTSTPVALEDRGFYIQTWHVDTLVEALVFVPIGILLLFAGLHLVNGMAALWRMAAGALLETDAARRGPAGVADAAPQAAPSDARPAAPLLQPPVDWTPHYVPGVPPPTASYLNVPQVVPTAHPLQSAAPTAVPQHVARTAAAAPSTSSPSLAEPSTSSPPPSDPAPPRRPQPPKPPIWEEDDA